MQRSGHCVPVGALGVMGVMGLVGLQAVATVEVSTAEPVRVGLMAPARVAERGLSVGSPFRCSWRPLLPAREGADRAWVEVVLVGGPGRARLRLGGGVDRDVDGAVEPLVVRDLVQDDDAVRRSWRYADGTQRARELRWVDAETAEQEASLAEDWRPGECRVQPWPAAAVPGAVVAAAHWIDAGLLPRPGREGRELRDWLAERVATLRGCPGPRGRGDFLRGPDERPVVTNLEYDTALGLCVLGMQRADAELLRRGYEGAWHTVTRDLDRKTGLAFTHGPDHRTGTPAVGHVWLRGVLLAGLLHADDDLIEAAASLARSVARHPPRGMDADVGLADVGARTDAWQERARAFAWPLWELEAWLRWQEDPVVERAADALAAAILGRFDPACSTFVFGEGEGQNGGVFERAWITGGIVLPALRAHLERRNDPRIVAAVAQAQDRLVDLILDGRPGLPLHYRIGRGGQAYGVGRRRDRAEGFALLEGLTSDQRRRCLRRRSVRDALGRLPLSDDADAATTWSMVARCRWVWGW